MSYITSYYTMYYPGNHLCKADCHQNSCVLDCDTLNLTSIPTCDMISINCSWVKKLRLRNNKIRNLLPAGLAHFTNLQVLDISDNPLEICMNSSFVGLDKVSHLYMHHMIPQTTFLVFKTGCFQHLTSIKSLHLGNSRIHLPSLFKSFCSLSEHIKFISMNQ